MILARWESGLQSLSQYLIRRASSSKSAGRNGGHNRNRARSVAHLRRRTSNSCVNSRLGDAWRERGSERRERIERRERRKGEGEGDEEKENDGEKRERE